MKRVTIKKVISGGTKEKYKNLYLEKAYAAGKAADTEIIVLKTVYVIEFT